MTEFGPYGVHPFAEQFPLLAEEEFAELVADIKKNGLREPITLSSDGGTIVDGRNRYRACTEARLDPVFNRIPSHYTEGMILDLIVSKNIKRRHLNVGQRAFVGLAYEKLYAIEAERIGLAKQREAVKEQPRGGGTRGGSWTPSPRSDVERRSPDRTDHAATRAAKAVESNATAILRAKAVQQDAPDLAEKVRTGEVPLNRAYSQTRERVRQQPKPEPPAKPTAIFLTLRTHDNQEVKYPQPKAKSTFNSTPGEGISWAEWSWNPVTGCLHGCNYCYAREIATSERMKATYPAGFTPLFHKERLDAPQNTIIPSAHENDPAWRRVFVCSMADLYGRWVPDEWIKEIHASMLKSPQWEYLLLTKFPSRYIGLELPPSAWVGTSVDEQKRVRIAEDAFRKIEGVKVKWLSLEPLREPLEFTDLSMFDWIVIGAQTETRQPDGTVGSFAPPFEWVARLVLQAKEAGCKVHMKPNLLSVGMQLLNEYPDSVPRYTERLPTPIPRPPF